MQLKRLKRQWRQEWEAEHAATRTAANAQDEDEIIEQINAKIQAMADRHDAAMTPATRALHAAWRAAQDADETAAADAADAAAPAPTCDNADDHTPEDDSRPDPYPRIALSDYRQAKGPAR